MREAAKLLHISHSGLSKSIKVLEDELGVRLLVPDGRGIAITDKGRDVYQKGMLLLAEEKSFLEAIKGNINQCKEIRIGTFEVFSTYFLGEVLDKDFSDFTVLCRERVPGELEESLVKREVDIGITYIPIPNPELEFLKITSVRMGIYGRSDKVDTEDIHSVPFAAPAIPVDGSPTQVKGLDGWPDDKFPRNLKYKVDMMETALELCRLGKCVMYIPSFVIRLHNKKYKKEFQLSEFPTPTGMKNKETPVYLVKRRASSESTEIKKIAAKLRQIVSSL